MEVTLTTTKAQAAITKTTLSSDLLLQFFES